MKKLLILSLFALAFIGMVFAQADPRPGMQELTISAGAPAPTTTWGENDPHYLFKVTDSGSGLTFGTDSAFPQNTYFYVINANPDGMGYLACFDQAAWAVAWPTGATLTLKIWYRMNTAVPFNEATDPYVQKLITVPAGTDPILIIPSVGMGTPADLLVIPAPPVTDVTLTITSDPTGQPIYLNGVTTGLLTPQDILNPIPGGVYTVVNPLYTWAPLDYTVPDPAVTTTVNFVGTPVVVDTWTYNLQVNGPDGYAVAGPYPGITDYLAIDADDAVNELVGTYTIAAPPAGFMWVQNPITVTAADFTLAGVKMDYVYNGMILFELIPVPPVDTWTYNLAVNGPDGYAVTGPVNGVTDYMAIDADDAINELLGDYTIAAPPAGFVWVQNPITVTAADFTLAQNKVDYVYNGMILFELVPEPVDFTYFVESHEYDVVLEIPFGPDLNAEILFNGASFPIPIFTPYTFGLPGNYPFVAGIYSVTHVGFIDWQPVSITFDTISGSTSTDFWGIPETVPVELSSFTATLTADLYVTINWVSQSETNMMGYRVYRNTTNDQSTAELIDHPFVPAHNSSTTQVYTVTDQDVTVGTYYYWLESVEYNTTDFHGPVSVTVENNNVTPVLPELTAMKSAYPNPFRTGGSTNIDVNLKAGDNGTVTIYNILGQVVRTYSVREGNNTIIWNGKDSRGSTCGNGIYFYKLSTQNFNETKKMVIVK